MMVRRHGGIVVACDIRMVDIHSVMVDRWFVSYCCISVFLILRNCRLDSNLALYIAFVTTF